MQQDNCLNNTNHHVGEDETSKSFDPRYLAAKKSIDDRALNHHVWKTLRQALVQPTDSETLKILELGTGIGTMLERLVDRGLLTGPSTYLATDMDLEQIRAARKYLSQWAEKHGHSLSWTEDGGRLRTASADILLRLEVARAEELAQRSDSLGPFHLVLAHAVLDLVDVPAVLTPLLSRLTSNGLAYFTCNFDGETIFLPECEAEEEIIRAYHNSMEARLPGASHTGRRLLTFLQDLGLEILAAGSSDWVIHPRGDKYSPDEIFFLHTIIQTVEKELAKKNRSASHLANLTTWTRLRHQQVETGQLSFLARHLDLLMRHPPSLP
jgi:SAM-dependent methyltransferase